MSVRAISLTVVSVSVLAFVGCGGGAVTGPSDRAEQKSQEGGDANSNADGEDTGDTGDTGDTTGDEPIADDGETACTVTHFTSGEESNFRVQGPGGEDTAYDCIKCPGPDDVIKLTYSGTGFLQELVFDGSLTNGSGAAADELILEQTGNVCWSEDYDAGGDLPSASAFTVSGRASTIEFDKGPDTAGPSGTLSYYKNGVLQFAIPVTEGGALQPYPDDGVRLQ